MDVPAALTGAALPLPSEPSAEPRAPMLTPGTQLLGPYQDAAYETPRFLVRRIDGQLLLVSSALYCVIGHLDGRASMSEVAHAVSHDLGRPVEVATLETLVTTRLAPLGVIGEGTRPVKSPASARQILGLTFRFTLLPARIVRVLGAVLAPLFAPVLVAYALVALVGLDVWFFTNQSLTRDLTVIAGNPRLMSAAIGLYLLGSLFHESGHAAAAVRGGASPGRIGMGLYVIMPAFFTDVSDTYRLGRTGRLRTDLGGVYFNVLFAAALGIALAASGSPVLGVAFVVTQMAMLQQLLPLVRLDGYFVLGDLIGVPDLFARVRPSVRALLRWRRAEGAEGIRVRASAMVTAWSLVVYPVLLGALVLFLLRLPSVIPTTVRSVRAEWSMAAGALAHGHLASALVVAIALLALCLPFIGMAILLLRSGRSVVARLMRKAG